MKKIIIVVLSIVMLLSFCISTSANEENGNIYHIGEKTVIFEVNSDFTVKQQEAIALFVANPEYGVAKANVLCSLFGHKYTTELAHVITHEYFPTAPRCKQETFEVTYCTRCDESSMLLIGTSLISCCP